MIYTKYVQDLCSDLDRLRNELKSFMIVSDVPKIKLAKDAGISNRTLYLFLAGEDILERTAWKIAHYLEKHLQKH